MSKVDESIPNRYKQIKSKEFNERSILSVCQLSLAVKKRLHSLLVMFVTNSRLCNASTTFERVLI